MILALVLLGLAAGGPAAESLSVVKLPEPARAGRVSVEEALWQRRSERSFVDSSLSLAEAGQVLWAAYGVNRPSGLRTAPSAGACYPLEVYLVAGNVAGLLPGVYRYRAAGHELELLAPGDRRAGLAAAALGQRSVAAAPAAVVWSAVEERTTRRYGARGQERYVGMDIGHSAENVYLQCAALGLGTVAVGAFDDSAVVAVTGMPAPEQPRYIMPFGRPQR